MAAKKSVKKYQTGGPTGTSKTRTVTKSPDGAYKTVTKSKSGPSGFSNSTNTRRTIKGVISGAPKPGQEPMVKNYDKFMKDIQEYKERNKKSYPPDTMQPKQKKGGSVKRKK